MDPVALITCVSLLAVDGDTVKCDGELLRPMGDGTPHVSGFDTPEMPRYAECAEEVELGFRAALRMSEMLRTPGLTIEDSGERDKTQAKRRLVWLRLPDGSTVGHHLVAEGLARVWTPGSSAQWCED
ncbi:MAG: thermonuclease [Paracoccaceae bacterium]